MVCCRYSKVSKVVWCRCFGLSNWAFLYIFWAFLTWQLFGLFFEKFGNFFLIFWSWTSSFSIFFQSGLCSSSQLETSRGSIRIHHLTGSLSGGLASQPSRDQPRFPRLEDCAHFHYEFTEIGPIAVRLMTNDFISSNFKSFHNLHSSSQ